MTNCVHFEPSREGTGCAAAGPSATTDNDERGSAFSSPMALTLPSDQVSALAQHQKEAASWFVELRDDICKAFEVIEDALPENNEQSDLQPGRFIRTPWERT